MNTDIKDFLLSQRGLGLKQEAFDRFTPSMNGGAGVVLNLAAAGEKEHHLNLEGAVVDSLTGRMMEIMLNIGMITPERVRSELARLPNDKAKLVVSINSPGGSVFDAADIIGQFASARQDRVIEMRVMGVAASAAASIALSGTSLTINEMAMMMIHTSSASCVGGNAKDLTRYSKILSKVDETIIDLIINNSNYSDKAEVKQLLDDETWFSAKDCLECGFAEKINKVSKQQDKVENRTHHLNQLTPEEQLVELMLGVT